MYEQVSWADLLGGRRAAVREVPASRTVNSYEERGRLATPQSPPLHSERQHARERMARRMSAPGRLAVGDEGKARTTQQPAQAPRIEIGRPAVDPGNKYVQARTAYSGRNVFASSELPARLGVRNEDVAVSGMGLSADPSVGYVVVADGHGAVPAYSETGADDDDERVSVFLGGYECAALVANSVLRYLDRVSYNVPLSSLDRRGMARVLYDAFAFAQRVCVDETAAGAAREGDTPERTRARLARLISNPLDGHHFRRLYGGATSAADASALGHLLGPLAHHAADEVRYPLLHTAHLLVADKIVVPYRPVRAHAPTAARDPAAPSAYPTVPSSVIVGPRDPAAQIVYYVDGTGRRRRLAEFGTTATVAVFVPAAAAGARAREHAGTLFVAHVGDSDAYVFHRRHDNAHEQTPAARRRRRACSVQHAGRLNDDGEDGETSARRGCNRRVDAGPSPSFVPVRLTGDHTVSNTQEIQRLASLGMVPRAPYWLLAHGPERGHMLMPSRAFGHTLLSKHGIVFEPTVSATELMRGDIVVLASDGLWASYGNAVARGRARDKSSASRAHASHRNAPIKHPLVSESAPRALAAEDKSARRVARLLDAVADASSPSEIAQALVADVKRHVSVMDNTAVVVMRVV